MTCCTIVLLLYTNITGNCWPELDLHHRRRPPAPAPGPESPLANAPAGVAVMEQRFGPERERRSDLPVDYLRDGGRTGQSPHRVEPRRGRWARLLRDLLRPHRD